MKHDIDQLARAGYAAYGEEVGGVNYQGLPMPNYDALGEKIQNGWRANAARIAHEVLQARRPERSGPVTFHLNAQECASATTVLSYEDICHLAGKNPAHVPTVAYSHAAGPKPDGILCAGESVELGERTVIDCVITGRA